MDDTKKVLLVDGGNIDKILRQATQNLLYVNVLPSIGLGVYSSLYVYSILQHDTLAMTQAAVNRIVQWMHTQNPQSTAGKERSAQSTVAYHRQLKACVRGPLMKLEDFKLSRC